LRAIFSSKSEIMAAIEASAVSKTNNTAFIERHNGTDSKRNSRKVRKSYCFSKDWYDGLRLDRTYLVFERMSELSGRSIIIGHKVISCVLNPIARVCSGFLHGL